MQISGAMSRLAGVGAVLSIVLSFVIYVARGNEHNGASLTLFVIGVALAGIALFHLVHSRLTGAAIDETVSGNPGRENAGNLSRRSRRNRRAGKRD